MLYSTPLVFIRASTPREAVNLRTCQGRHHGESMVHFDVFFVSFAAKNVDYMNRQSIFVRIQRGTKIVIITFRERGPVHVQFKCVSEEI